MSDSNVISYKFRTVVLPYSNLEVVGETWDDFYVNLTLALGSEDLANAYIGMRQYEVQKLVEEARNSAKTVAPEQGVQNAVNGLGASVLCDKHAKAAPLKKAGPNAKNPGREFYGGCQPGCDFFQWAN